MLKAITSATTIALCALLVSLCALVIALIVLVSLATSTRPGQQLAHVPCIDADDLGLRLRGSFSAGGTSGSLLDKWVRQFEGRVQTSAIVCKIYQSAGFRINDAERFQWLYITDDRFRSDIFDLIAPTLTKVEFYTLRAGLCDDQVGRDTDFCSRIWQEEGN